MAQSGRWSISAPIPGRGVRPPYLKEIVAAGRAWELPPQAIAAMERLG